MSVLPYLVAVAFAIAGLLLIAIAPAFQTASGCACPGGGACSCPSESHSDRPGELELLGVATVVSAAGLALLVFREDRSARRERARRTR